MKVCSKATCTFEGRPQPLASFNKVGKGDNQRPDCSSCQKAYNKEWRKANPRYNSQYYENNKDAQALKTALWREANPEYGKTWYADNKEAHRKLVKAWEKKNPEKLRSLRARWAAKRRTLEATIEPMSKDAWKYLTETFGEYCLVPGCGVIDQLEIDHVVPLSRGGSNDLDNLQILCKSHNASKSNRHSTDYRPKGVK